MSNSEQEEEKYEFLCAICMGMFVDPVTLASCSHSFCKLCLTTWIEGQIKKGYSLFCPMDNKVIPCTAADTVDTALNAKVEVERRRIEGAAAAGRAAAAAAVEEAVALARASKVREAQEKERQWAEDEAKRARKAREAQEKERQWAEAEAKHLADIVAQEAAAAASSWVAAEVERKKRDIPYVYVNLPFITHPRELGEEGRLKDTIALLNGRLGYLKNLMAALDLRDSIPYSRPVLNPNSLDFRRL